MINVLLLKILGVIPNSDLFWREKTAATCREMSQKLGALGRFSAALDVKTHMHLFKIFF